MLNIFLNFIFFASSLFAAPNYVYKNGKCVDAEGKEGLNRVSAMGPCTDFRGLRLGNVNLDDLDLTGSQFVSANLQNVSFKNSVLNNTSFEGAELGGVQFSKSKMLKVNFQSSIIKQSSFVDATLTDINFNNSVFRGDNYSFMSCMNCSFVKSDLQGTNFENAELKDAQLAEANLTNANFQNSNLSYANFEKSTLKNANFQGCQTKNAIWKGATFNRHTTLPFSQEEAQSFGMTLYKFDSLAQFGNYNIYKVPVEDYMTDVNILKACEVEGLRTPCNSENNGDFSDNKCFDVGWRDGGFPMQTLSKKICDGRNPNNCEILNDVFIYMGGQFASGSGCGAVNGTWCAQGNSFSNKFALCTD